MTPFTASLGLTLVWAFLPDEYFFHVGITYIPQKSWAYRFPCFILLVIIYLVVMNYSYSIFKTPDFTSYKIVTDRHSVVVQRSLKQIPGRPPLPITQVIPEIHDLPISHINEYYFKQIKI